MSLNLGSSIYSVAPLTALFTISTALLLSVASVAHAESVPWQAPGAETEKLNPVRYDVESVNMGKTLFATHCLQCHGYWGEGDGIVGLMSDKRPANLLVLASEQSPGAFAWKIAEGRNTMPSFRGTLSEQEIWHVVNFIASLENEVGSAEQSIVVQRCAMCHGLSGKAIYEQWPDLPAMSQQEIEAKLFAHRSGIIADSTMSKVSFDLTDEEIKEAARYYSSLNRSSLNEED
ncbi:MAG: c-type cytochrome [Porticoccaceae bacterium]|nr:c-type cytochrome [Porticoccaceae bacterium]